MSQNTKDKIRLICTNPACFNKALVYRKFDILREQTCAACKKVLSPYKGQYRKINREQIDNELRGIS